MKKISYIILIMVILIISGCGSNNTNVGLSNESNESTPIQLTNKEFYPNDLIMEREDGHDKERWYFGGYTAFSGHNSYIIVVNQVKSTWVTNGNGWSDYIDNTVPLYFTVEDGTEIKLDKYSFIVEEIAKNKNTIKFK